MDNAAFMRGWDYKFFLVASVLAIGTLPMRELVLFVTPMKLFGNLKPQSTSAETAFK